MNILFISNNGIEDAAFGGAKASRRNYELLKKHGDVDVIAIQKRSNVASMVSLLQGYFPPSGKEDLDRIGKMLDEKTYDFVFFDGSHFGNLVKYVKDRGRKVMCFCHNCEYDYIQVRFGAKASLKKGLYKKVIGEQERLALQSADCSLVFTRRDAERLEHLYGAPRPYILPLSLEDAYEERESREGERICLLFGPMGQANEEAFGWFVEEVSPALGCKTRIAGKGFEAHRKDWESQKVEVRGFVEDIAQLYADASCVAIPLLSGGGMKIKTAEALMFGKYIFGTDEAFVGYDLEYGKIGGKCNSAREFSEKINEFLSLEKGRFCEDSRKIYEENYSLGASEDAFARIVSGLV